MLILRSTQVPTFTAADGCRLAEVVHPRRGPFSPGVSLARASLAPGQATSPHLLDFVEIYYIIKGQGLMHAGDESAPVVPEDCVYLPPGTVQWIENQGEGELVFLCVCAPAYDPAGDHPA